MSEEEKPAWWPDNPYTAYTRDGISGPIAPQAWERGAEDMYIARQWQIDTLVGVLKDVLSYDTTSPQWVIDEVKDALLDVVGEEEYDKLIDSLKG